MASTNKTSLGFNEWVLRDKPHMDDFNADNKLANKLFEEVEQKLADKAEIKPPVKQALQLAEGWVRMNAAEYFKTQENVVTVTFKVGRGGEAIPAGNYEFATLPKDCCPVGYIPHGIAMNATFFGEPMVVWIGNDGVVKVKVHKELPASVTAGIVGSLTFVAGV